MRGWLPSRTTDFQCHVTGDIYWPSDVALITGNQSAR